MTFRNVSLFGDKFNLSLSYEELVLRGFSNKIKYIPESQLVIFGLTMKFKLHYGYYTCWVI